MLVFGVLISLTIAKFIELQVDKVLNLYTDTPHEVLSISGRNMDKAPMRKINVYFDEASSKDLKIIRYTLPNAPSPVTTSLFDLRVLEVDLGAKIEEGAAFQMQLELFYKGRYVFKPARVTLKEDQIVEFTDRLLPIHFDSEMNLRKVSIKFVLGGMLHERRELATALEAHISDGKYNYVLRDVAAPYQRTIKLKFTLNLPLPEFTRVERTVSVSMWGNIHDSSAYYIVNRCAELDGEYSTIDYNIGDSTRGKNALRILDARLDGLINSLSIRDEIGNLTRPLAYRDGEGIVLGLIPRFSLFGNWKSTFFIDFNQHIRKHFFYSLNEPNTYRINYKLGYLFESVFAHNYTLNVCLPEGSAMVSHQMAYAYQEHRTYNQYDLLEGQGKVCHSFLFPSMLPQLFQDNFEIIFTAPGWTHWRGLVYLIFLFSLITMTLFALNRLDLSFSNPKKMKA